MTLDPLLILPALYRAPLWVRYAMSKGQENKSEIHATAAISWLVETSKAVGNRGFSHSLHFARGWLPAYPETTGYIIPTLDIAGRHYKCVEAINAAKLAWDWLKSIQQSDGAFADLRGNAQVFDTGQILIGACFLASTGDASATDVASKAAKWLVKQQSDSGSFIAHAYNNRPHSYYSRVGAALIQAGKVLDVPVFVEAGLKNIEWTLQQQQDNGWFNHMSFDDDDPYSHTIIYTLEGMLAAYRLFGDERFLNSVVKCASRLRKSISEHGGVIRSQYNEYFLPVNKEICVTGLSQWAALCYRLERLGVTGFHEEGLKSLAVVKKLQIRSSSTKINGALPGSSPISGKYLKFALPNWGVKFFLDALLEADSVEGLPTLI